MVEWWPALEIDEKKKRLRKLTQPEPDSADRSFVVADSSEVTYYKLLRLPGQQPVPPVQVRASTSFALQL